MDLISRFPQWLGCFPCFLHQLAHTGKVKALVGGNLLTALRTAAASSASIKHLAPKDAKVLGMISAGHQSAFQMRAAVEQRNFEKVIGWNYHPEMLSRLEDVA